MRKLLNFRIVRQLALIPFLSVVMPPSHAGELLLVKWRNGPECPGAAAGNRQLGVTVMRNHRALGWQLVELPEGKGPNEGAREYLALGTVLAVEPDRRVKLIAPHVPPGAEPYKLSTGEFETHKDLHSAAATGSPGVVPNDPMFRQQWGLRKIGATNAWATTTGSRDVVVTLIDGGINYKHQDLKDNMWRNPGETGLDASGADKATNGIDDDNNGYVDDVFGIDTGSHDSDPMDQGGTPFHGTFCASVIGATGNDGIGVAGLNWRVSLMAIRAIPEGDSWGAWLSSLTEGYEYVLLMKERGVNIRVAGLAFVYASGAPEVLREAHEALGSGGILQISVAHNQGANLDTWAQYPSAWRIPSMITVGGSDESDNLWSSSNYGQSAVDLVAPASAILAASGPGTTAYETVYGTSFAGPLVTGTAALLLSVQPNLTADQIKAAIFGSVDQPRALKGKVATNGRLNVARALDYLATTNPPAIVVTASPRGQRTSPDAPINVTFNRAMNRASVENALVIEPPIHGTFKWAADNRSFSFIHDSLFDSTTNYTIRLLHSAKDESGQTLDGNFSRVREESSADDFYWSFNFPLPNDDFENAMALTGEQGFIQGSNRRASVVDWREVEIFPTAWQTYGSSLWYRWTPPATGGWFTFDLTTGTAFDSLLLIYAGNRVDEVAYVTGSDNHGTLNALYPPVFVKKCRSDSISCGFHQF